MSKKFDNFAATPEGRALVAIIENPAAVAWYRDLSARGRPAVQAIVVAVAPIIAQMDPAQRDFGRQFCGYWVGQVMRRLGYRIARSGVRVTVKDAAIASGTVWALDPAAISVLHAPPEDRDDRIELRVYAAADGTVMAEWRAVRCIESPSAPAAALAAARAYAEANGFRTIVLDDPAGRLAT